ncbi:Hypothetical protein Cp3995_1351 [Corynebacterium pseudotuberculosis 3/99-5]|nr:Hypothetical protein Cp3995_1351 [Corynebacterium pseudotuberculosis 3/99-5]
MENYQLVAQAVHISITTAAFACHLSTCVLDNPRKNYFVGRNMKAFKTIVFRPPLLHAVERAEENHKNATSGCATEA